MRRFDDSSKRNECGFTLVELLVVMAIISILAALLLPALENAMDSARAVACSSQFRQILTGCGIYAADNDEYLPVLNSGREGNMGMFVHVQGTSYTATGITTANAQEVLTSGRFGAFAATAMDSPLRLKDPASTAAINLPPVFSCPGLPPSFYLGESMSRTNVSVGNAIYRNSYVVGFGSLLGHNHGTLGNCCIRTDSLRMGQLKKPEKTIILNDLLMIGGASAFPPSNGYSTIPHGVSYPSGANQGTLDGSVRFVAFRMFTNAYRTGYPWDNKVYTPMNIDKSVRFHFGGSPEYANGWTYTLTTVSSQWQGVNTLHTVAFQP